MKWLLRFLLWATLLSAPAVFVSGVWQRGLAQVARAVLAMLGQDVLFDVVQVMAPLDLAIFTAMCFATTAAPWRARRRALAIGLPALVGLEVAMVVAGVGVSIIWPEKSPERETSLRLTGYVLETIPWVSGAVMWLLLLGAWELRMPVAPAPARSARSGKRPAG